MKWEELDPKAKRKALIFAAIVGVALLVLIWPSGAFRPTARSQVSSSGAASRPKAEASAPRPAVQPVKPAPGAGIPGKWVGEGAELANHRVCRLWLEIGKSAEKHGGYTGAATLNCAPILSLTAPTAGTAQAILRSRLSPMTVTMSGIWEKDAVAFLPDRQLNAGGCAWTRVSVSRFGSQNLSAVIEDACGGGSVLLGRIQ
jgi:hypothetical protein